MNYKESITALLEGLKGIFENKTATEASAIAQAATKPSTIFYTSDTHAIVVGGQVYGRSNQVSADAPFSYLPADVSSPAADPQFDGNHDTIYIQPIKTGADAGKIKLWWYVNGAWTSTDTLDLVLPTEASDITYDLTNTPDLGDGDVQSAVEALDGKVEDLRDEVLGDEWVDIGYGQREAYIETGSYILPNHNLNNASSVKVRRYHVNAGEVWRLKGLGNAPISRSYCWAIYDTYNTSTSTTLTLSGYLDGDSSTTAGRNNVEAEITIPSGGAMLIISYPNANASNVYIYRKSTTPLSIADKTGYKIDTWTDDEIITSTSLAMGSVVPSWSDGTRYGGRGVRLNVKEGDKVLLDTYSPALFGLIFTDENRVVKALYDDRRFDGVWTAPANGYCYIQDVLYRENYHYASAHGHLAYMAHDARKRVAKGGDWYNELAPRVLRDVIPNVENFNAPKGTPQLFARLDGVHHSSTSSEQALATTFNALSRGKMQYKLAAFHVVVHHSSVARGAFTDIYQSGLTTTLKIATLDFSNLANEDIEGWVISVKHCTSDKIDGGFGVYSNISTAGMLNMTFDKVYCHTSSDFGELYALAQKIISGEVEVDNFYGVREKEVDFVRNAIGLQSISDLGYNILEHGATLPIDEEGYKYAKEIYERYKDNPPSTSTQRLFENDQELVYLPSIDFSVARGGGSFMQYAFENCYNLICVDDIEMPSENPTYNYNNLSRTFQNCRCLKRVGNITCPNRGTNLGATFQNCFALEYVGRIIAPYSQSIASAFRYTYSLKRIEELNVNGVNDMSNTFQYCGAEYLLMKNIGRVVSYNPSFSALLKWGINSEENPDARQSLVDSLLTYSYDRVNDPDNLGTAGTTCTITLSANTYAQLTASEIEAITAKGYTLTHP